MDLVLTGHDHDYERSHPLKGGQVVPPGTPGAVTYLVVGTGGAWMRPWGQSQPAWSAFRTNADDWGYLDVRVEGGTLEAKLVTIDGSVADAFTLTKEIPPPTVQLVGEPLSGQAPFTARFTAIAEPADAEITWSFSDGTTASGPTVEKSFERPGTYKVTATATAGGDVGTAVAEVTVHESGDITPQPPMTSAPPEPSGPDTGGGCASAGPKALAAPAAVVAGLAAFGLAQRRRRRGR